MELYEYFKLVKLSLKPYNEISFHIFFSIKYSKQYSKYLLSLVKM